MPTAYYLRRLLLSLSLLRLPAMPLLLILTAALFAAAHSQPDATTFDNCDRTFSCGPITNATFPFTGGDRPSHCGLPDFALACRDDGTTEFIHDSVSYRVLGLNQTQKSLVLARSDLYNNSCPSVFRNTTLDSTHFSDNVPQNEVLSLFYGCNTSLMESVSNNVPPNNYFSCNSTLLNFNDSFYLVGPAPNDPILKVISCGISVRVPMLRSTGNRLTDSRVRIEEALMEGFDVSYSYSAEHERLCSECNRLEGQCGFNAALDQLVCVCDDKPCPFNLTSPPAPTVDGSDAGKDRAKEIIIIASLVSMSVVVIAFITICCFLKRRQHSQNGPEPKCNRDLENILLQHGSLAPKRYRYSEIKKITKSFSDKLGQGGYGCVYKGMLPDGQLVAVKILAEMDSNGEEFINEVASISRTSHVNIVNLFGFCYEGNKRALVYEYMPNSSLDKFLCNNAWAEHGNSLPDLKKLYEIAVGIAKGLEYLHTGCITRIVHFDIKPQNILLDQDLCPKISDFGLAKLCKKKQSVLSVLGTRGTAGYIAPEVFSRSFGEVSHKSDVYSYGMMLLEMAGARNATVDEANQSSENYFPDKIYEQVIINADDLRTEEEDDRRRKMLVVGFWCIQTIPSDRPSISKVAEMLEGDVQSIQTPPKPLLFSANVDTDNPAPDY